MGHCEQDRLWCETRNEMNAKLAAAEARAERAEATVAELDAEVKRLKGLLDRDRTGLASALSRIDREVSGRMWVADSRGCYEWDDDAYKAEAGDALRTVQAIATEALRESGTVANEGFFPRLTVELDTERETVKALTAEVAYLRALRAHQDARSLAYAQRSLSDYIAWLAANPEPQPPDGCAP